MIIPAWIIIMSNHSYIKYVINLEQTNVMLVYHRTYSNSFPVFYCQAKSILDFLIEKDASKQTGSLRFPNVAL